MKNKILLPAAGAWLATLLAAYYIGSSQTASVANSSGAGGSESTRSTQSQSGISSSDRSPKNSTSRGFTRASSSTSSAVQSSATSIKNINQLSDPLERSRQMLSLIDSLGPDAFEAVLADFTALGMTNERITEYNMLLHAWAKVDPLAALSYSQSGPRAGHAVKEVLASWAASNPNAALVWARDNHDGDQANPHLVGIIRGLADTNPTLATQVLQELPYSSERGQALRNLTPYIASLGIDGAHQWLTGLEDPQLVSGASAYIADQFSKQDPATGAEWVSRIEDGEARARALNKVVDNWTSQDPAAAKEWIATLPYDDQLNAGPKFVGSYAKKDASAAADWLDSNANASNYQQLLKEFAEGATRSDPVLALNYGNELDDEGSRSKTVTRALWTLYKKDKASAQNWIQNNDIPKKLQGHVNKMMD